MTMMIFPNCQGQIYTEYRKKGLFFIKKRKRNSVLTEREELTSWQRNYMYDIRKFREKNRPFYYLDKTWINDGDCFDTVWQDNHTQIQS